MNHPFDSSAGRAQDCNGYHTILGSLVRSRVEGFLLIIPSSYYRTRTYFVIPTKLHEPFATLDRPNLKSGRRIATKVPSIQLHDGDH